MSFLGISEQKRLTNHILDLKEFSISISEAKLIENFIINNPTNFKFSLSTFMGGGGRTPWLRQGTILNSQSEGCGVESQRCPGST